jgi:hypothetical protein
VSELTEAQLANFLFQKVLQCKFIRRKKMANLKIYDLHAADSEMHELTNDELKNLVGGKIKLGHRDGGLFCPPDPPWPPKPPRLR